jgi:hypothetical protein
MAHFAIWSEALTPEQIWDLGIKEQKKSIDSSEFYAHFPHPNQVKAPKQIWGEGEEDQVWTAMAEGQAGWADAPDLMYYPEGEEGQVLTLGAELPEWGDFPVELPADGEVDQILALNGDLEPVWVDSPLGVPAVGDETQVLTSDGVDPYWEHPEVRLLVADDLTVLPREFAFDEPSISFVALVYGELSSGSVLLKILGAGASYTYCTNDGEGLLPPDTSIRVGTVSGLGNSTVMLVIEAEFFNQVLHYRIHGSVCDGMGTISAYEIAGTGVGLVPAGEPAPSGITVIGTATGNVIVVARGSVLPATIVV